MTFGYFMGGINFGDMAFLKSENIVDGRLVYIRRKTHKLIRLPLQPKAIEIIERYHTNGALFLFPILSDFHKTEQQQRNRLHKVLSNVNKRLNPWQIHTQHHLYNFFINYSETLSNFPINLPTYLKTQIRHRS